MNTICQHLDNVCGVHLVKARTPGGRYILVCHKGTLEEAIQKARRAGTGVREDL